MPRIAVDSPRVSIPESSNLPDDECGSSLDDELATMRPKSKTSKKRGASPSQVKRALESFDRMFAEKCEDDPKVPKWRKDPKSIQPEHAVALYFRLHEKIYKVKPAELESGPAWLGATSAAKRMIANEFANNGVEMFDFILWVWQKERSTVEWLRKEDKPSKRPITWYDQFVDRRKLTHYRQTMAEERERNRGARR
jgi:hypothetical protein